MRPETVTIPVLAPVCHALVFCRCRPLPLLRALFLLSLLVTSLLLWSQVAFCNDIDFVQDNGPVADLTRAERDFLDTHKHLRVHVERGYHPFAYVDNATARGYAVDLSDILARRLGIELEYVTDQSWEEGISQLKHKNIDIILCMVDTPVRREFAHFTEPFLTTYTGIATRTDFHFGSSLEELNGQNVGVLKGYWHHNVLIQHYPHINAVTFPDHVTALEGLATGKVDAVLSSNPVLTYHIRQLHMLGVETRPILGSPYFRSTKEGYGVRKDMPLLATALQKGLDSLSPETLNELRQRWFIDPVTAPNSVKLSVEERRHLKELGELRLCVDPNWMPLEGIDAKGNYTGLGADYFALLKDQLPIPIRLVPTSSWMETLEKARSGACDLISMVTPTAQRSEYLNFTRPYLHLPIVVATRGEEIFIENMRQMRGRRLGSTRGYAVTEEFRRRYPAMDLVETETVAAGIRKVQKGRSTLLSEPLPPLVKRSAPRDSAM